MHDHTAYDVDFAADGERLRQSLQVRPNPDVAKGVLMVLRGCDGASAFAELLQVSRREEVLLADLAAALAYLVGAESGGPTDVAVADLDPRALAAAQREWGPALRRCMEAGPQTPAYTLPWGAQHLAEAAEYIGDLLAPRSLVALGMILRARDRHPV